MIKYKYFIKTENEFKLEFGWNWRRVGSHFVSGMDKYLGVEIDILKFPEYIENGRFNLLIGSYGHRISMGGYIFSGEMIKEVKLVNYNKKRILVYE